MNNPTAKMKTEIKSPPRCKDCRFLEASNLCHKFPPGTLFLATATANNCAHPRVNPLIDWCGFFEPKPKEQNGK